MKTYKLILSAFALVATLSVNAFAQVSTAVEVSANVVTAISATTNQDIVFGTINANTAAIIGADDTGTNLGSTAKSGKITLDGDDNRAILISATDAVLTDDDGLNPTDFATAIYYNETDAPGSAAAVTGANNLSGTGAGFIYVGGELDPISSSGSYSTGNTGAAQAVTVTIQYQ